MNETYPLKVSCAEPTLSEDGREVQQIRAVMNDEVLASVHFWSESDPACPMIADGRTALLAFVPLAMRLNAGIEVLDPVDALSLSHLEEWQQIMARWHGPSLRSVPIHARQLRACSRREPGTTAEALMGFSGGVDSCHTLWRHSAFRERSPVVVKTGLLVHGMDIPLSDHDAFIGAIRRVDPMLQAHGASLRTVATDIRALERRFGLSWGTHTHGIVLGACLSLFEKSFDAVLIASTYPVHDMQFPRGSNPVSDTMLGGPVPFVHDGAAFNKLAKVREFAEDAVLTTHLRVCWEGDRKDANCGHCFKCLATQASLWLAGIATPLAFDRPAQVSDLAALPIKNAVNYRLVSDIRDTAVGSGRPDIARALERALRGSKWHRRMKVGRWLRSIGANP